MLDPVPTGSSMPPPSGRRGRPRRPASVLLSLLEIPLDGVITAVRLAAETGVRPVVTLAPAQPVPSELLSGLDPPLVNEPGALAVALAREVR